MIYAFTIPTLTLLVFVGHVVADGVPPAGEKINASTVDMRQAARGALASSVRILTRGKATLQENLTRAANPNAPVQHDGVGSGVVVFVESRQVDVVTNHHVIDRAEHIEVELFDGRHYSGKVVGTDPYTEVAVVRFTVPEADGDPPPVAKFRKSYDLEQAEPVLAVGSPQNLRFTVTVGVVSYVGRRPDQIPIAYEDFIQTDTSLNPGNSGGGLFDQNGRVVGINTAILGKASVGLGFSIPSEMVLSVARRLTATGKCSHGVLGIYLKEARNGSVVIEKLAIELRELKVGDRILSLNDAHVVSLRRLKLQVDELVPGRSAKLLVERDGRQIVVEASVHDAESKQRRGD